MAPSLRNEPKLSKRSTHGTSAQSIPTAPSVTNNNGNPPAGMVITRRSDGRSSVGNNARSHNQARMVVAETDHGSDTASATARPSAARSKCLRSIAIKSNDQLIFLGRFKAQLKRIFVRMQQNSLTLDASVIHAVPRPKSAK